jgi:hypothetical protein
MRSRSSLSLCPLLRLLSVALCSTGLLDASAFAQARPAATAGPAASRVDTFVGYTYFYPFNSDIAEIPYPSVPLGGVGSIAGYFNRHIGLQVEGTYSPKGPQDNNCVYTAQAGPILRAQFGRMVPFFHALGGGAIVGGPRAQDCSTWGYGGTAGIGLDLILPAFHDHLALRPIQVDFQYARIDNGPLKASGFIGGVGQVTAIRAAAGLVFRFGDMASIARQGASLTCAPDPASPFPGDPVTISSTILNVNPKLKVHYVWTSSGGKIAGDGPIAAINSTGMAPGAYEIIGKLVESDKHQRLIASCSTSFTVRSYDPPTISCSADRAAINSGDPVAIISRASSVQNHPLAYTYTTTSGLIVGNGPSASLSTAGVSPGNITVTCSVMDDKGQSAKAMASLVVATPTLPPPAAVVVAPQSLCSITFDRDLRRPNRVDNEAKACLDDVALTLNRQTTAKLLVVGSHAETEVDRDAAERTMNAADYLMREKGIDPARLDLRIGPDPGKMVSLVLLPPGAIVDTAISTSFDTTAVKRRGEAYGTAKSPTPNAVAHRRKKPVTTL